MSFPELTTVLLDVDGTLIDSNDQHTQSWLVALGEAGHSFNFEQVRPLIGMGGDKLLGQLLGLAPDDPAGKALAARSDAVFTERYLADLKPTPGVRGLLEGFKAAGLKLIVATSAHERETNALLKQAGVADLIDDVVTSSEAPSSKPDPDIVQQALEKAGAVDGQVVLVGDTPYDIEAAHAAGIRAVALRCGGWWDDTALRQAVAIYDDPADMHRTLAHLLKPS